MLLIALVLLWAVLLGVSPGLAIIALAVGVLALDRYHPAVLDRAVGRG